MTTTESGHVRAVIEVPAGDQTVVGALYALTPAEHATLGHTRGWCHNATICTLCAAERETAAVRSDLTDVEHIARDLQRALDQMAEQVTRARRQLTQARAGSRASLTRTQRAEANERHLRSLPRG